MALAAAITVGFLLITGCGGTGVTRQPPSAPPTTPATAPSPGTATPGGTPAPARTGDQHAPPDFVVLSDVDPTILTDIRYATPHNFVGRPITGYREPLCLLARQAAEALHRVQVAARARGYSLKVYDCYRPQQAVDDFIHWAQQPGEQQMKGEFYPGVTKSALFPDGYIGGPTAHSRGATVDLTLVALPPRSQRAYVPGESLVPCTAPVTRRFPDSTIDMGTGFDCFDPLSHTADPRITGTQQQNRASLTGLMAGGGFTNYRNEWWHYTLDGEPHPDTYYNFPVARSAVG